MPPSPNPKPTERRPPARPDRTSAIVTAGLVVLAVVGVLTVFSGPLMALVAPPPADHAPLPEPSARVAPAASPLTSTAASADGGADS